MDGVIVLDKPRGISSARALQIVRGVTQQKKSGHTGTLDPLADGILVICLGTATKLVESIMDLTKIYRASARLDVTSESFDIERPLIAVDVALPPGNNDLLHAFGQLEGDISQVPPSICALKIAGQPAYRRVARGELVELAPRSVRVYWNSLDHYHWPEVCFTTCCGRGTYVRALIRDIGRKLGCGGCLTDLRRTAVGPFVDSDSWTIDRLRRACVSEFMIPLETAREMIATAKVFVPPRPKTIAPIEHVDVAG